MNPLKSLFRSRDKPKDMLSGSRYSFFFGGTSSGKTVNEMSAMQMTAVYSCVRILSEAVASLPLSVYHYNDSGGKERALRHPLYRLLHDEPNPEMTSFAFRETLMSHLLLWGNAYAQVIRNARGEVIALYPLMPSKMTVDRDKNGRLFYMYQRGNEDNPAIGKDGFCTLSLTCKAKPYKQKNSTTTVTNNVTTTATITLTNGRMPAVPTITVTAQMTIAYTLNEQSYTSTLAAGTHSVASLVLPQGDTSITVTGTGTITFVYREGAL